MQSNRSSKETGSISPSIDELTKQFEEYKKRRILENEKLFPFNSFKEEISKVQNQFAKLCSNIATLKSTWEPNNPGTDQQLPSIEISNSLQYQSELEVICTCELDSNKRYTPETDIDAITDANDATDFENETVVAADKEPSTDEFEDEELFIKCKSNKCVMEVCNYCTSGDIMMVHYLSDQSVLLGFKKCYELAEDDSIVLSFDPKYCKMRHNQIMGSLAFTGASVKASSDHDDNSSSYARKPLNCYIPLSVIISKIDAGCGTEILERSDQCRRHVFVIWLATPYNKHDIEASLSICGRDPINTLETTIKVHHTESIEKFMKIDDKFWRLSNSHIEKLSNGYRDELHLNVRLTECIY